MFLSEHHIIAINWILVDMRMNFIFIWGNWVSLWGIWISVRGNWFSVRGNWFSVRGNWFLVRGNWFSVRGNWISVRGNWISVRGNWFSVRENWISVRGNWFSVRGNWISVRGNRPANGIDTIWLWWNSNPKFAKDSLPKNLECVVFCPLAWHNGSFSKNFRLGRLAKTTKKRIQSSKGLMENSSLKKSLNVSIIPVNHRNWI